MKSGRRPLAIIPAAGVSIVMLPMLAPGSNDNAEKDFQANGKGAGTLLNPGNDSVGEAKGGGKHGGGGGGSTSNGINYHGGQVMLGTVNVYDIWYGNWSGNTAVGILTDFANTIGGSPYFNINTTYYNGSNLYISNSVNYVGSTNDNYSRGSTLRDADIQAIVSSAIAGGLTGLGKSVYFVLTSQDVAESSGFARNTAAGTRMERLTERTPNTHLWAMRPAVRTPAKHKQRDQTGMPARMRWRA
jgi:Phosphate-induced protein 1 conserved region